MEMLTPTNSLSCPRCLCWSDKEGSSELFLVFFAELLQNTMSISWHLVWIQFLSAFIKSDRNQISSFGCKGCLGGLPSPPPAPAVATGTGVQTAGCGGARVVAAVPPQPTLPPPFTPIAAARKSRRQQQAPVPFVKLGPGPQSSPHNFCFDFPCLRVFKNKLTNLQTSKFCPDSNDFRKDSPKSRRRLPQIFKYWQSATKIQQSPSNELGTSDRWQTLCWMHASMWLRDAKPT